MTDPSLAAPAVSTAKPHHISFGWQMSLFFVTLLLVFVYLPIDIDLPESLFAFMFSVVLLAAIFAVRIQNRWRAVSIFLALASVALAWIATLLPQSPVWLGAATFGVSALFVLYTIGVIVVLLPRVRRVSMHTITAALSLYLLLGILGGLLFTLIEVITPGALTSGSGLLLRTERAVDVFPALLYFSFITLTTVGFGDIYPVSAAARATAVLEAVAGQIYLVVMVAVLVSMFAAERAHRRDMERVEVKLEEIEQQGERVNE